MLVLQGLADKITGLAEEIRGKLTHNPALVRHGHEIFSGEAKRKKLLGLEVLIPLSHLETI